MDTFNEHLSNLLTGHRNSALEKLRCNTNYAELKKVYDDFRTMLETIKQTINLPNSTVMMIYI